MIVGTYRVGAFRMPRPTANPLALPGSAKGKERETVEVIVLDSEDEDEVMTEEEGSATESEGDEGEKRPEAWIYMGSHNFTMAAWGSVSGSILAPKLNVRVPLRMTRTCC